MRLLLEEMEVNSKTILSRELVENSGFAVIIRKNYLT